MMDTLYKLATRAKSGDREALSDLVEILRPRLFAEAYSCLGQYEDAQDAVESALYHICMNVGGLRDAERVGAWMRTIVRNEAIKIRKRRMNAEPLSDTICVSEDHEACLQGIDIRNALRRLPRDNARAVALFYLAGVSIDEIARRTERPVGTIKRWLHHGRRRLAIELEDYCPMQTTEMSVKAAIISTDIAPALVRQMAKAMRDVGFSQVLTLKEPPKLAQTGTDDSIEFHLPDGMKDVRFVMMDEWVGGRSAFELHAILKAAAESSQLYCGLLLASPPSESTIFAAWAAAFDLCLTKGNLDMAELRRFSGEILNRIRSNRQSDKC